MFVKPQTSYCYGTKPYVGNTPVVFGAILEDRELDGNSWRMSSGLPTVEEGHAPPPPVISCVLCNPSSTECLGGAVNESWAEASPQGLERGSLLLPLALLP